ncbi:MAG: hypothetical protein ABW034_10245 [Steroidobacteraceae bacterium]
MPSLSTYRPGSPLHPQFAEFLVDCGIDSISVSPDSFLEIKRRVAAAEAARSSVRREPAT